jgi:hypothetical protein
MSEAWEDEGFGGDDDWEAKESVEADLEDELDDDELEDTDDSTDDSTDTDDA